jgi:cell division initiation protein
VLRETCRAQKAEVDRFRSSEHAIFDTLESAKGLMRDISSSAEKRAEIVLKNAELDAERMQREARESVERITEEAVEMARRWEQFKLRYRNLLQMELDRFESLSADLIGDADHTGFYSEAPSFSGIAASSPVAPQLKDVSNISQTIKTQKRNGL